ncbi:phosphoglycerate kinase [Mycoplasma sp. P36-A1]|uniref:phosphoglycerate kinase n=1 Tax=Mycoplasma sp. P36-A1 TaxID=3252900 RepID=UPI003C2D948D
MIMKKTIKDLDLYGKKVFVRVDFNVPLNEDGSISDDNRIVQALPTIKYLKENGARIILASHLGKVKTEADKEGKSLKVVSKRLSELLNEPVEFVPGTRGPLLEEAIRALEPGEVLLMENTRFELDKETKNDEELAKYWASLVDLYVSDAFGSVHRAHASTAGVPKYVDSAIGFLIEKELNFIGSAINNPKRPMIAILGGKKVSDKIDVINNLITIADKILIGGGMAYTFLKAQGYEIGNSVVEEDKIADAKAYLEKANDKIVLPIDIVVTSEFSNDASLIKTVDADKIAAGYMGLDIGPKTIEMFKDILKHSKTVIWNGPMGVFELSNFANGTIGLMDILTNIDATTIIGGGDSAAAAIKLGYASKFSHVSTGGGASLEFMEGKKLPGIEAIADK